MGAVRFFLTATRGSRLTPWKSPYLRWRMETYTGIKAANVRLADYLHLAWRERGQMLRFLRWLRTMERIATTGHHGPS